MDEVPEALWHATPLHALPAILAAGSLYAPSPQSRPGPARRLRALGLTGYVFLALAPRTPLLADRRRRGGPHALLRFSSGVLTLPGVALCRYNTKAWAHRDLFAPVVDPAEQALLLAAHARGRYPSLAVLVPAALPLSPLLEAICLASDAERGWLASVGPLDPRVAVVPDAFPPGPEPDPPFD